MLHVMLCAARSFSDGWGVLWAVGKGKVLEILYSLVLIRYTRLLGTTVVLAI